MAEPPPKTPSDDLFAQEEKQTLLEKQNQYLHQQNKELSEQNRQLLRLLYGKKSEKTAYAQALLGGIVDTVQNQPPGEASTPQREETTTKTRKKRKGTDLSGIKIECERLLPESVQNEPEKYEILGDESAEITDHLEYEPAKLYIHRTIRPKCVLKKRDKSRESAPICAPAPKSIIPGSYMGASLLAYIAHNKYSLHLPCERQLSELSRMGLPQISNQHLCGWLEKGAQALYPLYNQLHAELLNQDALHIDETPVRCLNHHQQHGYMWVMTGSQTGQSYYHWGRSRSKGELDYLLRRNNIPTSTPYPGIIITDDYASYDAWVKSIPLESQRPVQAACWTHARRKFKEAEEGSDAAEFCREIIQTIAPLYGIEKNIRENKDTLEQIRKKRQQIKPHVIALFEKLEEYRKTNHPLGKLKTAINYTLGLKEKLQVYLEHPQVGIDNNPVERAIRKVAIGRKNWNFIGHPKAGTKAAIYYTLISECKRIGIDPMIWLTHVFRELPKHNGEKSIIESLMPISYAQSLKTEKQ